MLNRRHCLSTLAILAGAAGGPAQAQFRVEIAGIGGTQLPITLAKFRDEGPQTALFTPIIRADLERSGRFRFVEPSPVADETISPAYDALRAKGSDTLVAGSVRQGADGRLVVNFKLWDVVAGQEKLGQSITVAVPDARRAAHRIADVLYEFLTGDKGVYSTQVAYITRTSGRYELRLADADGENSQLVLSSASPLISPAWSPSGEELAYVSFETGKAVVWVQNLRNGQRRQLANFRGSNSAPAWSPNGQELAMTLSRDGVSQVYVMSRAGGNPRRVTNSGSIDTEAAYSPDGRTIYFVSDRGGSPQIYRVSSAGGDAERITFDGNYNISPAISPDGRTMAYVKRQSGQQFTVMTMDLASGSIQNISDTTDDESPSFAPNGKFLVYATRYQGREVLMTATLDGKVKARLVTATGVDIREPVWGPYLR